MPKLYSDSICSPRNSSKPSSLPKNSHSTQHTRFLDQCHKNTAWCDYHFGQPLHPTSIVRHSIYSHLPRSRVSLVFNRSCNRVKPKAVNRPIWINNNISRPGSDCWQLIGSLPTRCFIIWRMLKKWASLSISLKSSDWAEMSPIDSACRSNRPSFLGSQISPVEIGIVVSVLAHNFHQRSDYVFLDWFVW